MVYVAETQSVSKRFFGSGFHWLYMYEDGMCIPKEFDIIDFRVGLYAFATDIIIDVLEVMRYTGEEELDECEFAYHSCDRRN